MNFFKTYPMFEVKRYKKKSKSFEVLTLKIMFENNLIMKIMISMHKQIKIFFTFLVFSKLKGVQNDCKMVLLPSILPRHTLNYGVYFYIRINFYLVSFAQRFINYQCLRFRTVFNYKKKYSFGFSSGKHSITYS